MKKFLPLFALLALLLLVGYLVFLLREETTRRPSPAPDTPVAAAAEPAPAPPVPAPVAGAYSAPADPRVEAARNQAQSRLAAGDLPGAIAALEAALANPTGNQLLTRDLSHLYAASGWNAFSRKDLKTARGFFEEGLYYWAENPEAFRGLAFVAMETNQRDEAEGWIKEYLAAGGDRPEVYALQGRIAYEAERLDEALYYFRISLALDPNQPEIAAMVEKIGRENRVESGFDRRETRHFLIKYEGTELPEVSRVVELVCEEAYLVVGRKLGHYPESPVTVILYTDRQFQDVTRSPAWAEAIFDGKIRIPAKGLQERSDELERIVFHEYAHAVIHDLSRGRAPIWLHEGIAQQCEGIPVNLAAVARRVKTMGGPLPLPSVEGLFVTMPRRQAELAYIQSRLAAEYLGDNFGPYALRELLRDLGDGDATATAIRRVTGRDYATIDAGFRAYVLELAGTGR